MGIKLGTKMGIKLGTKTGIKISPELGTKMGFKIGTKCAPKWEQKWAHVPRAISWLVLCCNESETAVGLKVI